MSDDRSVERHSGGPTRSRSGPPAQPEESTPNTALNALIGGVVTAGTAFFVPFSPALGGGVAGFLEGGDTDDGLKVGTLAGLVAMLPLLLVAVGVLAVVPVFGPPRSALGILLLILLVFLFVGAYTVGLSALGGILGAYLKREL